jgi:hypothetical protein
MHPPGGKPLRSLIGIGSVMTRPRPVRCGKSRRVASNGASGRLLSHIAGSMTSAVARLFLSVASAPRLGEPAAETSGQNRMCRRLCAHRLSSRSGRLLNRGSEIMAWAAGPCRVAAHLGAGGTSSEHMVYSSSEHMVYSSSEHMVYSTSENCGAGGSL